MPSTAPNQDPAADLRALLSSARVVPILTVDDPARAVPLVGALVAGGLATVEITLRTERAMEAVERVVREVAGATVGVGTVLHGDQLRRAEDAGARFAVSPGLTGDLVAAARRSTVPLLPGVATVTEALTALGAGFPVAKLFPAAAVGGLAFLDAVAAPLPQLLFCPTGGLDAASWGDYLARPNVVAVGGSWMVPRAAVAAGDWGAVERAAGDVSRRLVELAA